MSEGGHLSIVATPIGNLEDITLRALRTLREADLILAEDTRRTGTLLQHYDLRAPLRAFHAHTPGQQVGELVERIRGGARVALVTDAGTPLVSDPGGRLVAAAAAAGVRVEPIPGASAVLAALTVAGLDAARFRFVGFLPRSGGRRRRALAEIADSPETTALFEAPLRVGKTLRDLAEACGADRPAALCRELTKLHEEVRRGTLEELADAIPDSVRGEVTLVVSGAPEDEEALPAEHLEARARALLEGGARPRDAARLLAAELGLKRRDAYAVVLRLRTEPG